MWAFEMLLCLWKNQLRHLGSYPSTTRTCPCRLTLAIWKSAVIGALSGPQVTSLNWYPQRANDVNALQLSRVSHFLIKVEVKKRVNLRLNPRLATNAMHTIVLVTSVQIPQTSWLGGRHRYPGRKRRIIIAARVHR